MAGFELFGEEERAAVNEVFDKGGVLFRHGFEKMRNGVFKVDEFEKEFAKHFNVPYARAVSSGTAALKVALKAIRIQPGDEVITQCFTFVATVEAIIDSNATPIITDINKTLNMDPSDLERKITKKTKAIIPVHMLGVPSQMQEILLLAKKKNIPVIEDTAQGCGGEYRKQKLGTLGDIGIFSFDFGKELTTGEGGMVVTHNKDLYLRAKEYSDHGHEQNPNFPRGEDTRRLPGFNFSMTELQGAIGLVQLKKLDYGISRQRENKRKIKENLQNKIPDLEFRELPDLYGELGNNLVFFVKNSGQAELFMKKLTQEGFGTNLLPSAIAWHFAGTWDHMLPQCCDIYKGKNLVQLWKNSHDTLSRAVAIPIMVKMNDEDIQKLCNTLIKIFGSLNKYDDFRHYSSEG